MFKKTIAEAKSLTNTTHEVTITVNPEPVTIIAKSLTKYYAIGAAVLVATHIALRFVEAVELSEAHLNN